MKFKQISGLVFHWVLPLVLLSCAAGGVVLYGNKPKSSRKKPSRALVTTVEVIRAQPHKGPLTISATGIVVPFREIDLATQVDGPVAWKSDSLLPGQYVANGQELLRIDDEDYKLNVARLEQQLKKADKDLARVEVVKANTDELIAIANNTLNLRTRELELMNSLRQNRATSDTEYGIAEKNKYEADQALTTLKNRLNELEAEKESLIVAKDLVAITLQKSKLDESRTLIVAPTSGVIIEHMVEADSHVQAGDVIARLEDTSRVEVRCSLRKEDLDFLPAISDDQATGTPADAYRLPPVPVTVRYSRAGRHYTWQGILSRQDGLGMDERTRTMPVRVSVENPLQCKVHCDSPSARPIPLVRGMFVTVELHCQPDRPLLQIPEEAIRPGKKVWIMVDNKLKIQPVHIARIQSGIAYVDADRGSISHQHAIIRSPVPGAKDGLDVAISQPKKAGRPRGDKPGGKLGKPPQPGSSSQSTAENPANSRRPGKLSSKTLARGEATAP